MSLSFDDSSSDSLLGSRRRICSISTSSAVHSTLVCEVTSSCDECSASFLSAASCTFVASQPPASTQRLLDVAVLNPVLELYGFLLFNVKLGILVFQGLLTKFLLFVRSSRISQCCLLLGRCQREATLSLSCPSFTDFTFLAHLSVQRQDMILGVFCSTLHGRELIFTCNQLFLEGHTAVVWPMSRGSSISFASFAKADIAS